MSNAAQYRESVRIHPLQKRGDEPTPKRSTSGADLGGGCRGCVPSPEITCGFLIQLVFCKKKKHFVVYWCWSRARDECTPSLKKSWICPWTWTISEPFKLWLFPKIMWEHELFWTLTSYMFRLAGRGNKTREIRWGKWLDSHWTYTCTVAIGEKVQNNEKL